jgi:hypothetical protein
MLVDGVNVILTGLEMIAQYTQETVTATVPILAGDHMVTNVTNVS